MIAKDKNPHAILLISCPDQKGITATVTNFIFQNNGNILDADQHIDEQTNTFFMRLEWDLTGFRLSRGGIQKEFGSKPNEKTYWVIMPNNILNGSRNETVNQQKDRVEKMGGKMPNLLEGYAF